MIRLIKFTLTYIIFVGHLTAEPVEKQELEKELIIGLRQEIGSVRALASYLQQREISSIPDIKKLSQAEISPLARFVKATCRDSSHFAEIQRAVAQWEGAASVHPNYVREFCDVPNDPLISDQWALSRIHAFDAWETETGSPHIILAIIDSGVDYYHPDLSQNIWRNSSEIPGNQIDDDGNGYIDDIVGWDFSDAQGLPGAGDFVERDNDPSDEGGHGTHVAGIVAAAIDNDVGIGGVAPNCQIMPLRAGFRLQSGAGYLQDDDIAAAIVYAADNGANAINMSFGDPRPSHLLRDAIDYAVSRGCVAVAAAGNDALPRLYYPAAYDPVIAVGASDQNDLLSLTSSYGPDLDAVAPGVSILSAWPDQSYAELSGTSMAAPHVTGAVGLLLAHFPTLSPHDVRSRIRAAALDLGEPGADPIYGSGRLDLLNLLTEEPGSRSRIDYPESRQRINSGTAIVGVAHSENFSRYRLEYGVGFTPAAWTEFDQSTDSSINPDTLGYLDTSTFPEGTLTIRLTAESASGERFVAHKSVIIDHTATEIIELNGIKELNGNRFHYLIEWGSTDIVDSELQLYFHETSPITLDSPFTSTDHSVDITPYLSANLLEIPEAEDCGFRITLDASSSDPVTIDQAGEPFLLSNYIASIDLTSLSNYGFQQTASLPDGRFLDRYTDFDHDGQPELVVMMTGDSPYQPITIFERTEDGVFEPVTRTTEAFLPWDAGDADSDGKEELLVGGVRVAYLLEAESPGSFPSRIIWQSQDVWGQFIADTDQDGRREIVSRYDPSDGQNEGIIIFESTGDDQFSEGLILPNPTSGSNGMEATMAVGDFDGDGRGDILCGDIDGDFFIFEAVEDNSYQPIWASDTSLFENLGSIVSLQKAGDLNQDGSDEFLVAVTVQNQLDPDKTHCLFYLFSAIGNNQFEIVWHTRIGAGDPVQSGVKSFDYDQDGMIDLAIHISFDLYIFKNLGEFGFQPIFHTPQSQTPNILIQDGDQDGLPEIVVNRAGQITVLERLSAIPNPYPPTGLTGHALNESSIMLNWDDHPSAASYKIYRGVREETPILYAEDFSESEFIDTGLSLGQPYSYMIRSVDHSGAQSPLSPKVTVTPSDAPTLVLAKFITNRQVSLQFDLPMESASLLSARIVVDDSRHPDSFIIDRGGTRLIVSFREKFQPLRSYTLSISGAASRAGVLLNPNPTQRGVHYEDIDPPVIEEVIVVTRDEILAVLSEPIDSESASDLQQYRFDPLLLIKKIASDSTTITIELSEQIKDIDYLIEIQGITDLFGNEILKGNGNAARFSLTHAENVFCYPNPVWGESIGFGNLPEKAEVRIFTYYGDLVKKIIKEDAGHRLTVSLKNDKGKPLSTGTYFFSVTGAQGVKNGKFAILR
ncbi:MAG: hypothetical protein B6244_08015 [Candidatus Cloacimonetes bacterium 4572_55]|nr:MAG: hypothetical protein B6244_08015 [Candidatus Cloacimonetes bacterium 4572_55]